MTISALPVAPSRSSPTDFSAKADAFIAALPVFVTEANALAAAMNLNDTTAASTTSLAIGAGSKSLTVDLSKSYQVGMSVKIAYDSTNWMHGEVTSYNSGTGALVVNVTNIMGSGTHTAWAVTLSGPMMQAGIAAFALENIGLVATVGSKALTVALKGADGNNPSATNIARIAFRDETLATGTPNVRTITGALAIILSSGSTLGFTAAEAGRLYVWAIDNAGTVELALSRTADIFPEGNLISTTAEGGAGAADSVSVMYSTTARSNVACRCIGYIEITTGAVPGEWDNAPTKIQVMGPGVRRTGDIVQEVNVSTGAYASSATAIPFDDTIPQITEGVEVMTAALTPTSAINKALISVTAHLSSSTAAHLSAALFKDAVANAIAMGDMAHAADYMAAITFSHEEKPVGTTSQITYRLRAGAHAGSISFNGTAGARKFGGVLSSSITVKEVFA